ncbi:hypothetical protein F5Y17DRAFT_163393 [Xylariaceae sp. FL0594]|nr:hypothetical protein F5Y17DRAFT_163393 [Xylariaceae sp. FL0594]
MASKTSSIPRFLLPQRGPMWRTAAAAAARSLDAGLLTSRYASSVEGILPNNIAATRRTYASKSAAKKAAARAPPTKPPPGIKNVLKPAATTKVLPGAAHPSSALSDSISAPSPASPPTEHVAPGQTSTTPVAPELAASSDALLTQPVASASASASEPAPTSTSPDPTPAPRTTPAKKPLVLEKPERFNPPSHGSRLPRSTPRHYGGPLTSEELKFQATKSYPGLPPPPNTWSHWFINSRGLHTFITLGTLTSLAVFTWVQNFKAKSPYVDMIPPGSEFWRHPFQYVGVCLDVLKMTEEHESARTAEKRRRRVEDVAKRNEYRKAHGLEPANQGLFGAKAEVEVAPVDDQTAAGPAAPPASPAGPDAAIIDPAAAAGVTEDGKRKKFMGIF